MGLRTLGRKVKGKIMSKMIMGVVRHLISTFGGGLVAQGVLSSSDLEMAIGSIVTLVGIVASVLAKREQAAVESVKPRP